MKVKVRKKPAPAVECGKRVNVTADIPFLTRDIDCYFNHRKYYPLIREAVRTATKRISKISDS